MRENILSQIKEYVDSSNSNKFIPGETYIPPSGKMVDGEDISAMAEALLDVSLTAKKYTMVFEKMLSSYVGVRHALMTNSGSSANLLAISALTSYKLGERALNPGDEVITVAAGFPTTINPIIQNKLVPVFVDIDLKTYQIDIKQLKLALSEKTKAVIIAHGLGNPFNVKEVVDFCKKNNLWLIEDACDALGGTYDGKMVGTFGDLATLSFYPAHQITTGEGGAILINSPKLKVIVESFRDWGRDCWCDPGKDNTCHKRFSQQLGNLPCGYDHKYTYSHIGYNLKSTDVQAALGISQLKKIEDFVNMRKKNWQYLKDNLTGTKGIVLPVATEHSDPSWFGFAIRVEKPLKNELIKYLDSFNIGTRNYFAGNILNQPGYLNIDCRKIGNLDNTNIVQNNVFWVGVYPGITKEMLDFIILKIKDFMKQNA
jgi:CDP-6-deoxy-D-xylo-4-hexulose-3-dehydrase